MTLTPATWVMLWILAPIIICTLVALNSYGPGYVKKHDGPWGSDFWTKPSEAGDEIIAEGMARYYDGQWWSDSAGLPKVDARDNTPLSQME